MASFDLDKPSDDIDTEFARRLIRASERTRTERSTLWIGADDPACEGEIAQAASAIGQPIQRRPRYLPAKGWVGGIQTQALRSVNHGSIP
jgi:hypothetical protein